MSHNGSYDAFIYFRAVMLRAIAKSWADPAFKQAMLQNPKQALETAFHYTYPFAYDLSAQDNTANFELGKVGNWVPQKLEKITLVLPPHPAPNESDPSKRALIEAQALAAFNASHVTFLPTTHP